MKKAKKFMKINTKEKKELGNWGEKALDEWMKKNNWNPINKNLKIKRGEIDRIYFYKNRETQETKFCITEVKTSLLYRLKDIDILFTETGVKRYLKQRQIQNLYRYGENLIALLYQQKSVNFKVYLRFFIVLKSPTLLYSTQMSLRAARGATWTKSEANSGAGPRATQQQTANSFALSINKIDAQKFPKSTAIKNCYQGENYFIFSIEPEFTGINSRKSLLQVKIY